jgi:hypothetical protein
LATFSGLSFARPACTTNTTNSTPSPTSSTSLQVGFGCVLPPAGELPIYRTTPEMSRKYTSAPHQSASPLWTGFFAAASTSNMRASSLDSTAA